MADPTPNPNEAGDDSLNEKSQTPKSTIIVVSDASPEAIVAGLKANAEPDPSAAQEPEVVHATDLTRDQWSKILSASGALKAWKGQVTGDAFHVNRAPTAAVVLDSASREDSDGIVGIPEFEVADDTYVETRESRTSLEREMTLKAFSESGINAALSGGAQGISLGLGGNFNRSREQSTATSDNKSSIAIHGFYNFPRAILHLDPDAFKLSAQCERFFSKHQISQMDESEKSKVLSQFTDRFGAILACRVTLGGRLCTTQELRREDQTRILEMRKDLRTELTATVTGAGVGGDVGVRNNRKSTHSARVATRGENKRMVLETQGGNGLLASSYVNEAISRHLCRTLSSNILTQTEIVLICSLSHLNTIIPDWTTSVGSYRHWRAIQQDDPQPVLPFLAEVARDSTQSSAILALLEHASKIQQATNLSRLNYIDVVAYAEYKFETFNVRAGLSAQRESHESGNIFYAYPPGRHRVAVFAIEICVSRPEFLNSLGFASTISKVFGRYETVTYYRSIERESMKDSLRFQVLSTPEESPGGMHKLSQAIDVKLKLTLEPFMDWDTAREREFPVLLEHGDAVLEWNDIELNSEARWELPISRVSQKKIPPSVLEGTKTNDATQTVAVTAGTDSAQGNRARNLFKKT